MEEIIAPIDKDLLKKELNEHNFIRPTNKGKNEIYITTAHESPNLMQEIGRLRELAFRSWGGGTAKSIDTDSYDLLENPYRQLFVWDPDSEEIVGGYRFLSGKDVTFKQNGQPEFTMGHLFEFSNMFIKEYLPYSIELGRAFIQPDYQTAKKGVKSLFAFDNLWDGVGALIHDSEELRYLFGKVTIYNNYSIVARELLYEYMFKHFADSDRLITPKVEVTVSDTAKELAQKLFVEDTARDNYKILQKTVRNIGTTVPPMYNAYIGLTDTMRMFGTMLDPDFSGGAYESGIMVTVNDLFEAKRKRYIEPYVKYLKERVNAKRAARKLRKTEVSMRNKLLSRKKK